MGCDYDDVMGRLEQLPNGNEETTPFVAKGGEVVHVIRADGLGDDLVRLMAGDRVIISPRH